MQLFSGMVVYVAVCGLALTFAGLDVFALERRSSTRRAAVARPKIDNDSKSSAGVATAADREMNRRDKKKDGITQVERAELLIAHNRLRASVTDPPAADMTHMVWSAALERTARYWARKCNFSHGFPPGPLEQFQRQGQNIFASRSMYYNLNLVAQTWFNERVDFKYGNRRQDCKPGRKCGHYKQLVWANSLYVGCSIRFCADYSNSKIVKNNVYNVVCNYSPPGNVKVRAKDTLSLEAEAPYIAGKPCSHCDSRFNSSCENKLCRTAPDPCQLVTDCKNPRNVTTCLCDSYVGAAHRPAVAHADPEDKDRAVSNKHGTSKNVDEDANVHEDMETFAKLPNGSSPQVCSRPFIGATLLATTIAALVYAAVL